MHPFDLRQMMMEKHAQHVVLIHFPIALFIAGVGLDFVAQWTKRPALGFALGQKAVKRLLGPDAAHGLDMAAEVPVGERVLVEEDVAHVKEEPADHPLTSSQRAR